MSSIDDIHSRYAIDSQSTESFKKEFHIQNLGDTRMVSDHVKILDYVPKPEALVIFLGINERRRKSFLKAPPNFNQARFSFFESIDTLEMDEADLERVYGVNCKNVDPKEQKEREKEQKIMGNYCQLKLDLRQDARYIKGRILEFVRS